MERDDNSAGNQEGAVRFQQEVSRILEELVSSPWHRRILTDSINVSAELIAGQESGLAPIKNSPGLHSKEYEIITGIYNIDRQLTFPVHPVQLEDYVRRKAHFLQTVARELKKHGEFDVLPYALNLLLDIREGKVRDGSLSSAVYSLMLTGVESLYLLMCDGDKALVGIKDGVFWKKIKWSEPDAGKPSILLNAFSLLFSLPSTGRRELVLVPDKLLNDRQLEAIRVPTPPLSTEALLEDAYYHFRFMIPLEGAEVHFSNMGDVEKMTILQRGDVILAKASTAGGDFECWLNLSVLEGFSTSARSEDDLDFWGNVIAEVYHNMVTGIPVESARRGSRGEGGGIKLKGRLGAIYIPRNVRSSRLGIDDRPRYNGPPRSDTPYRVGGHKRRANMTESHRLEIMDFEQKNDMRILDKLPDGYTWVRPFTVPEGADLSDIPQFIKRRMETRLISDIEGPNGREN